MSRGVFRFTGHRQKGKGVFEFQNNSSATVALYSHFAPIRDVFEVDFAVYDLGAEVRCSIVCAQDSCAY